jgi:ribonuclease HI
MRQAGDILRVLVKKMPDEVLQDYFGDLSPAHVRKILQDAAAARPSPQANLWQGKDRDWKGKLKGTTLYLYSDGASRGNPGEAGAGIAILDEQGNELVATGEYLGQCTNNEAEYRALLFGLAKCKEFGRGRIKTHLDSELIVKQILGQYRVKHPNLIPLFKETMKRFADFASFSVVHVRREKNSRADEMANRAIDIVCRQRNEPKKGPSLGPALRACPKFIPP